MGFAHCQSRWVNRFMVLLVTPRHISFIYSSGNGNINSIITSVKITGRAAEMIKHQEEHSSVIYLEYVVWYMHCESYQCFLGFFFFFTGSELLHSGGPCAFFPPSTGETARWPCPRSPRKMQWIMMITGSRGFQHLLTIIKMSASHDKAHLSNTPPSVITRSAPAQVQMKNSIQPINRAKSERTWAHILLLEK